MYPPRVTSRSRGRGLSRCRSDDGDDEPCLAFTQSRSPPGLFSLLLGFSASLSLGRNGNKNKLWSENRIWLHRSGYYSWFTTKLTIGTVAFYKAAVYVGGVFVFTSTSIHSDAPINPKYMPMKTNADGTIVDPKNPRLEPNNVYVIMLMTTSFFGSGEFLLWR